MAERYTRLFALTENLYQSASPVMIAAGALLKDTQTGRVLAQVKLQSLSDMPIKAAKVNITPLDVVGNELGEAVEHPYLDLNVRRDGMFGAKSPIYLPNATTRAFRAAVISVVFADNSVWEASNAAWEPLPKPVTLAESYPDAELRKQFKLEFGARSQYAYGEFADLCRCPCGALNRQEETVCHVCGIGLTGLRKLDIGELEKRKDERLEQERLAEEQRQEQVRIAKEKAAAEAAERTKKAKKIALIAAPIICVVVAFLIVLNSVIIPNSRYNKAADLMEAGETTGAALLFGQLGDYKDAHERSLSAWGSVDGYATIAAGHYHTVALKSDGTVVAVGDNENGQCEVDDWTDIVVVVAGGLHTIGLKSDGTVVAAGENYCGQCDVGNWANVVAVSVGAEHTIAVYGDGTVVSSGNNDYGQCDMDGWTDIVAVAGGFGHSVGLKLDGTVVAVGDNEYGQCDVSAWTDIVAVVTGNFHTVALKSDGTVVAVGDNQHGQCNVDDWTDIIAVSAGAGYTVGLRSDGSVLACGYNEDGRCDVSKWEDITAISTNFRHTVAIKENGEVVALGENLYGQCNVSDWTDIKLPE